MTRIIVSINIFIYTLMISNGCKIDWDPTCKTGKDCCSKRCFKEASWENGFCISGKTEPPKFDKCQPDYFDRCIVNEHCCSKLCNRSPYDQFGTCTLRALVIPAPSGSAVVAICENDGFDKCTSPSQCCSGICEQKRNQKTGICKPMQPSQAQAPQCLPDWSDRCGVNEDCCSRLCDKNRNPKSKFGLCTPTTAAQPQPQPRPQYTPTKQCKEDWATQCINNEECCSGLCEKFGNHGTCKPTSLPTQSPQANPCAYDGFNQCTYNENCCSEYCDKNLGQYYGVCRPPAVSVPVSAPASYPNAAPLSDTGFDPAPNPNSNPYPNLIPSPAPGLNSNPYPPNRRCNNDWFNKCTNHDQCCSGWCKTEGNWKYGVCNPTSAPSAARGPARNPSGQAPAAEQSPYPSNIPCREDFFNRCTNHNQCCSNFCETEGNWKYGVCKQYPQRQTQTEQPKVNKCAPNGFNQCLSHNICCSGFCELDPQYNSRTCKPQINNEPHVDYRINLGRPDKKRYKRQ